MAVRHDVLGTVWFDVVRMPELDGLSACSVVRRIEWFVAGPALLVVVAAGQSRAFVLFLKLLVRL